VFLHLNGRLFVALRVVRAIAHCTVVAKADDSEVVYNDLALERLA
jgi:hypothetical protein